MALAPPVRGTFSLVDHHGRAVTDLAYRGHYMLVLFGFTHCRVVCPRALGRLQQVLKQLGESAERIKTLYISVDPERDTPEVMKSFLARDYPDFTGLTGSREQVDAAKRSFRVFAARKADRDDPEGYQVPHSAITYLIDPAGVFLTHFHDGLDADEIAGRLQEIISRAREFDHV